MNEEELKKAREMFREWILEKGCKRVTTMENLSSGYVSIMGHIEGTKKAYEITTDDNSVIFWNTSTYHICFTLEAFTNRLKTI